MDDEYKRKASHRRRSCKLKTLKVLHSRPVLIVICSLVVIECVCVLAELMVDLQGIRMRFENEETELAKFVEYLQTAYPDAEAFKHMENKDKTLENVLIKLKGSTILWGESYLNSCVCSQCDLPGSTENNTSHNESKIMIPGGSGINNEEIVQKLSSQNSTLENIPSTPAVSSSGVVSSNKEPSRNSSNEIFVIHINSKKENFYLFTEYIHANSSSSNGINTVVDDKYSYIHELSLGIHIGSLVILFIMVAETFMKLACTGTAFFKEKFEVFDAFIVITSFALDFIFLDTGWYETGKDATTILVLLLPWRVIRIVNSFLMTVNHKHHIEIATVRKAKKRAENKILKLEAVLTEIRKDVQLLVALCRNHDIPEQDISACIYGKGRSGATMSVMSSFASLMLISALGKDAKGKKAKKVEDEIYGTFLAVALGDDDDLENADDSGEETTSSVKEEKKVKEAKQGSFAKKRRRTFPLRNTSDKDKDTVFCINNGFVSTESNPGTHVERRTSFISSASIKRVPPTSEGGSYKAKKYVTFEVTTQVTYL